MVNLVLSIIAALIGILGSIMERRYDPDAIKGRADRERDKELGNKNHRAKSKRLSDLFDAVKLRNKKRNNRDTGRSGDNTSSH